MFPCPSPRQNPHLLLRMTTSPSQQPENKASSSISAVLISADSDRLPVEFYFADSNLPYDKYAPRLPFRPLIQTDEPLSRFMWTLHTANADHWVPIKTVSSFKRMKGHAVKGHEFIVRALKTSTELEVDDKGENVRRVTELQKPKDQFARSVYAVRYFFLNPFRGGTNGICVLDGIERVREGGARASTGTGDVLRRIWKGKRCQDASC